MPLEIGGGFGAKLRAYVEPVAALLARQAGVAVKIVMTRAEVFEGTGPTSGTRVEVKLGATLDGRITAASARLVYEAGGFPGSSAGGGMRGIFSPYDIANARIEGFDVVVNRPKTSAYRTPGTPAAAFTMETALDELAERLDMDPLELRLVNCAREGTRLVPGVQLPKVGFTDVLEAARAHPHYTAPLQGPWRGRVVASGYWTNGSGPSSAVAVLHPDGTAHLAEGSPDIGGSRTAVAQQFAETLGIAIEDVYPEVVDTDSVRVTSNTGSSGIAFKTGFAAITAAEDIKGQLVERAALIWECDVNQVEYDDGTLRNKVDPDRHLTIQEIASRASATGGAIVRRAGVNPSGAGPTIATHIVEVANPNHPFGVRSVGEVPIVPPVAAMANAIHAAIGVHLNQLPMKPSAVVAALARRDESSAEAAGGGS